MLCSRLICTRLNSWKCLTMYSYKKCLLQNKINHLGNHIRVCEEPLSITKHDYSTIKKYTEFDENALTEVFDVEEERERSQIANLPSSPANEEYDNEFIGLNLKRGVEGVFDIEDLVEVLNKESAEDVFVCSVPKALHYVDYLVICSGRSYRHMISIAEFVRRMYKIKRQKSDIVPKIEGKLSRDWMALDLGNIALHVMAAQAREKYDIESLWAIGSEYDYEYNKPQDPLVELFDRHLMPISVNQGVPVKNEEVLSDSNKN